MEPSSRSRSMMHSSAISGTAVRAMVRSVCTGSREASRAALALASSRWACTARLRAVMSRAMTDAPITPSSRATIGDTVSETSTRAPSARIRSVS
jgi:hypothetical protein